MVKLDAPHITIVVPRYWPATGGSELHAHLLVNSLCEQGWGVNVITQVLTNTENCELAATQAQFQRFADGKAEVTVTPPEGWRKQFLATLAEHHPSSALARRGYDGLMRRFAAAKIVERARGSQLIHFIYNGMTSLAEAALDAARALNIPFVLTPLANTELPPGTGWASRRMSRLLKAADSIIALTEVERTWLIAQGAPENKTSVCPMGPVVTAPSPVHEFRQRHALADHPVVLFLARHDEAKGYQLLAEARHEIWAKHPDTRLLFVGPQTARSQAFFDRIRDPRLLLMPNLSQPDKNAALQACSMLCVPSSRESLGSVYLEAWHYQKPVVALAIPVLQSLMSDRVDSLLCQPSPSDIATAINTLLDAPEQGEAMGLAGHLKQQARFRWPVIVDTHQALYKTLSRPALASLQNNEPNELSFNHSNCGVQS